MGDKRRRLRDLGIEIGLFPTGPHNAITDVANVAVGHCTIIHDEPTVARTGVTVILPRGKQTIDYNPVAAGIFSFSGFGEMTGWAVLDEFGLMYSPIGLTGTTSVGAVHEALSTDELGLRLPVVAETYDGYLSDAAAFYVRPAHVKAALAAASGGPVPEGNVGGGTGMICHGFKGGIGTASRRVTAAGNEYTLGALVQANYGLREQLRVAGLPIGQWIDAEHTPTPGSKPHPPRRARQFHHHCAGDGCPAPALRLPAPGQAGDGRSGAGRRHGPRRQRRYFPGFRHRK